MRPVVITRWLCILGIALAPAAVARDKVGPAETEFFERRIRPVLVENCYKCHSAQSEKIKGGLRLDTREHLLKGGESGAVLVPGNPEASLLIKAVRWTDDKLQMPPKKKLSESQIADLAQWVKMGAPDPREEMPPAAKKAEDHWAFQKVKPQTLPAVKRGDWPKTEVDLFILAALEKKGLSPSPPADKRTLIRRATYDLTGLPPTLEETRAFENDPSPEAFERVVRRLLDSPRYGERWGRHWLDVARFADTKGYVYTDREESQFVHSYVYRDWVINALNRDMPYDQFLMFQIAGDQFPEGDGIDSPLAATGFLTVGRRFLGVAHDIIDDRIDVLTKAAQALTVSCARCHDHKFDPIPIEDYYSLYGVFAGSAERTVCLEKNPPRTPAYEQFKKGYDERVAKLEETFRKRKEELLAKLRLQTTEYLLAVLEADKLPTEEHYEIRGPDDLNPTIARQWQTYLYHTAKEFHPVWAPWHELAKIPAARFEMDAPEALRRIEASAVNPLVRQAVSSPKSMQEVAKAYGELLARVNKKQLEKAGLTADENELLAVLYGTESPINVPPGSVWDIEWFFHEAARVEFGKLQSEIDRWIIKAAGAPRFAVTLEDKPEQKNPRVFRRGNPANKGAEVPRQYLRLIAGESRTPFSRGSGRLELARAIANPDNPLTARVMVNRAWAHHFGEGLVQTVNDFGTRSDPPSHPELLDWLASYFIQNGWSLKKLHGLIMLSSTYQQSSTEINDEARRIDPENRLLWRMNRRRLDFEAMRDSLLFVTAELAAEAGGKPVPLFGSRFIPKRSVYGFVDRQFLPGVYRVFDFPNPDLPAGQRSLTTVPQQALYLMNNRFLIDRARALALRSELEGSRSPEERIRFLYRVAFQREPSAAETQTGLGFIRAAESLPRPEPPPPPPPSAWSYGYGEIQGGKAASFTPLPFFADNAWQGSANYPDESLGWARLTAEGGHAGNDAKHAVIRRWTSPVNGKVNILGSIEHKNAPGDGIHALLVTSRHGILGEWNLHNAKARAEFERIAVQKGDTIDFVVDLRANLHSDDFLWSAQVRLIVESAGQYDKSEWDAKKEFSGPPELPPPPLKPWESYAQVLLLSNEFAFVD